MHEGKGANKLSWLRFSWTIIDGTSFWRTLQGRTGLLVECVLRTESHIYANLVMFSADWWTLMTDWPIRLPLMLLSVQMQNFFFSFFYLQSLLCHLHCHLPLSRWYRSLCGSCAPPSAWSWPLAAPLWWSLHPRPCRTNCRKQETVAPRWVKETASRIWWLRDRIGCFPLTSLKASLSSFTPIIPAVSARSFGVISSTKSSKSTLPPTRKEKDERASITVLQSYCFVIAAFQKCQHLLNQETATKRHLSFMIWINVQICLQLIYIYIILHYYDKL